MKTLSLFARMLAIGLLATEMAAQGQNIGPGSALRFVNNNGDLAITLTNPPANNYTISAWVNLTGGGNLNGTRVGVLSAAQCGESVELTIQSLDSSYTDPQYLMLGRCGMFNAPTSSNGVVPLNQWVHVAATVSNSTLVTYYVNGAKAGAWTNTSGWNLALGTNITLADSNYRMFSGMLDEVQIWSIPLSQAQIQMEMHGTTNVTNPNLVGYWRFDDGAGNRATNSALAGSASDAIMVGIAFWVPSGAPVGVPEVTSPQGAISVINSTEILTAVVDPYYQTNAGEFLYGTSTNLGSSTPWNSVHGGLTMNGTSGWVDMHEPVIPASGNFTVECWAECPTATSGNYEILSQGSTGNAFYIGDTFGYIRAGENWLNTGVPFPFGAGITLRW